MANGTLLNVQNIMKEYTPLSRKNKYNNNIIYIKFSGFPWRWLCHLIFNVSIAVTAPRITRTTSTAQTAIANGERRFTLTRK